MVNMKVSDENQVYLFRVDDIEVGKCLHSFFAWMNTTIHQYLTAFAFNVDTRATNLISRA